MSDKLWGDETVYDDLEKEFEACIRQADNMVSVLQEGADAFVKDLRAMPSPRSKISAPGYTHMIDVFSSRQEKEDILVGWGKYYGPIVEKGSRSMKAQPHFKPLWKKNQNKYYQKMIDKFNEGGT